MTDAIHIASSVLLLLGGFFVLVGGIGLLRMPDFYTRMHAGSVTETLGSMLIIIGLMLHAGLDLASFKLFTIMLFLLFTGPVSAYAMANAANIAGLKPLLGSRSSRAQSPEGSSE
ncbi:MAG: monovalent cation/H(+) antiporter subunit G [Proteobacteria bacterium]|jgi:multicomponent Na+:H+ antiporter subunit G|nr:monovalent cation/H(+) antiporter subunit G [Pseudomonadota bacterium]